MDNRFFLSALREVRSDLTRRPAIVGMLALGLILGISGPFNTINLMPALPRILYWVVVVVLTFAGGSLVSGIVHRLLAQRSVALMLLLSTCAIGLAVMAVLSIINLLAFGMWYESWTDFAIWLGVVTLISGVVEGGIFAVNTGREEGQDKPAPLLARLPLEKRGALIALSAEDHYVRVTTTRGEDLVLMRLSDAVQEVGSAQGLQIHRSHWIALDQIEKVTRSGDRGEVTLSDASMRPISRSYMPAVRAAGLLPKGRS